MLFLPFTVVGKWPLLKDNLDQKDISGSSMEPMFYVIYRKRMRVFEQGVHTSRNRLKHEAVGQVLSLFLGVWRPRSNMMYEFLIWLLKRFLLF